MFFENNRDDHILNLYSYSILVILVNSSLFLDNRHNFIFLRDLEYFIIK